MSTHLVDDAVKNTISQDRRGAGGGRNPAAAVDAALWSFAERLLAEEAPALAAASPAVAPAVAVVSASPSAAEPNTAEVGPEVVPLLGRRSFFVDRRESESSAELSASSPSTADSSGDLSVRSSVRGLPSIGRLRSRKGGEGASLPQPKKLPPRDEAAVAAAVEAPKSVIAPAPFAGSEVPRPAPEAPAPELDVPQAAASSVKALLARLTEPRRPLPVVVERAPIAIEVQPAGVAAVEKPMVAEVRAESVETPPAPELAVFEPIENDAPPESNIDAAAVALAPPVAVVAAATTAVAQSAAEEAEVRPKATFSILRKLRDQIQTAGAAAQGELGQSAAQPVEPRELVAAIKEPQPTSETLPEVVAPERPRPLAIASATPFPAIRRESNLATPRWVEEERQRPPSLGLTLLGWFGMVMGVVGVAIAVLAVPGWI